MRVSIAAVLSLTAGIVSVNAAAQSDWAGQIVYAHGQASVRDPTGSSRQASRGQTILAGETVLTGNGRMQMRMADGGFIQVQPNTQFKVDAYRYNGREDGSERSFFNLLKGGIRFVTGAIGHRNKDNFRIATAVATIGIRGSAGRADLCVGGSCGPRPNGLYVTGNQDTLILRNGAGEVEITPGQTFHTECATCSIQQVQNPPDAYAAVQSDGSSDEQQDEEDSASEGSESDESTAGDDAQDGAEEGGSEFAEGGDVLDELSATEFAAGDEREATGDLAAVDESNDTTPGPTPGGPVTITDKPIGIAYHRELSPSVYSAGVAAWGDNGGSSTYTLGGANNLPVSGAGVNVDGSSPGGTFAFNTAAAAADEFSSNAATGVAWARWGSNWSANDNGTTVNPTGWMHAIYATTQQVVSIPVSGTITYNNLVGGTAPTLTSSPLSTSGTLNAMSLQVNFDTNQVTGSMSGSFSTSASFTASMSGSLGADGGGGTLSLSGTCNGVCGSATPMTGGAEFGLVGANADAAAGAYDLKTSDNSSSITGTFLLGQ